MPPTWYWKSPCIDIYCGRNEGYPQKTLEEWLRNTVASLHHGLNYISISADDGVSCHGPYNGLSPKEYFEKQRGKQDAQWEGMANLMTYEGLSRTLDAEHLWSQNLYWGRHDYTMEGAQRCTSSINWSSTTSVSPHQLKNFVNPHSHIGKLII